MKYYVESSAIQQKTSQNRKERAEWGKGRKEGYKQGDKIENEGRRNGRKDKGHEFPPHFSLLEF